MRRYTYTQKKCPSSGGGSPWMKWVGIALMVIGILILLVSVPIRFWLALVGLALAIAGFILWRIST